MSKSEHFLFYSEDIKEQVLVLSSDEVAHITTVLKFGVGDTINVTDGNGMIYSCTIEKLKRDKALCSINNSYKKEAVSKSITLFVGIPEREKFETMCEELPPLAVKTIVPVIMKHTTSSWWKKQWQKSLVRFNRKIIASTKQSLNPFMTTVEEPITFEEALKKSNSSIFCSENGNKIKDIEVDNKSDISLFVGPPGGFSKEEIILLEENGGASLSLAPFRLRTELAATTAVSLLNQYLL